MAKAEMPKMMSSGTQVIRKMYLTSLPFHPHCLNLRANIGISLTST